MSARLVLLGMILAFLGISQQPAEAQSVQAFYLRADGRFCVDVPHGRTQVGLELIIWECRNRLAQGFVVDTRARRIRFRRDPNLCVEQSRAPGENRLMLVYCDTMTWNDWVYDRNTGIVSAAGRCWDVAHFRYQNGTPMIAYRCHGGMNQRFNLDSL